MTGGVLPARAQATPNPTSQAAFTAALGHAPRASQPATISAAPHCAQAYRRQLRRRHIRRKPGTWTVNGTASR